MFSHPLKLLWTWTLTAHKTWTSLPSIHQKFLLGFLESIPYIYVKIEKPCIHLNILKCLVSHAPVPFPFFPFSCRWLFQPVPIQTQSRSQQVWLRSNPKCCGLWAQCWLWSSSSSLSLPSCSLRSKSLSSVILLSVCVRLDCSGTFDYRFLLVASGWKCDMPPSFTYTQLLTDQTVTSSFTTIIYCAMKLERNQTQFELSLRKSSFFPKWFWPSWLFFNCTMQTVSRNGSWQCLANEKHSLAVKNPLLGVRNVFQLTPLIISNKKQMTSAEGFT